MKVEERAMSDHPSGPPTLDLASHYEPRVLSEVYEIDVVDSTDGEAAEQHRKFGRDSRADLPGFRDAGTSLICVDRNTRQIVAGVSAFLLMPGQYSLVSFWLRRHRHLIKVPLTCQTGRAITVGYLKAQRSCRAWGPLLLKTVTMCRALASIEDAALFIEPTGCVDVCRFAGRERLALDELGSREIESIGSVRAASQAVDRMCRFLRLDRQKNLYNIRTLGPVYANCALVPAGAPPGGETFADG